MTLLERAIAAGYGLTYDAVVDGFAPHVALLEEIEALVRRSMPTASPRDVAVLDVACGIGNACFPLARRGYQVCGLDAVSSLIEVAERKRRAAGALENLRFEHRDLARDPLRSTFDVVISLNTIYWHPDPPRLLRACSDALKPGGHGVFITYARPARVLETARMVRERSGAADAIRALRWLLPTALFELLRDFTPYYTTAGELRALLEGAGFEVLEMRSTFLAGLCHLAWGRAR